MYNSLFFYNGIYYPFYCNGTHIFVPANDLGFTKCSNKAELIKALTWLIYDEQVAYNSITQDLYCNHPLTAGASGQEALYQMYFGINFPISND